MNQRQESAHPCAAGWAKRMTMPALVPALPRRALPQLTAGTAARRRGAAPAPRPHLVALLAPPLLLLLLSLGLAAPARATVNISTNTTIDYPIDDEVLVHGTAIVSVVMGGSVSGRLFAYDSSTVSVSGGTVGELDAEDSSTAGVISGSISGALGTYGNSMATASGGSIGQGVFTYGSSHVSISGTCVISGDLIVEDNSTAALSGGSISGFLFSRGTSTVNVSGGTIGDHLAAAGSSMATVSGGSVGTVLLAQQNGTVTVSGHCLMLAGTVLTGFLEDGSPIHVAAFGNIGLDSQPAQPTLSGATASPAVLWPPNHKMVEVTVSYTASDLCGGPVGTSLSVTSNEPVNGTGDGDTAPDWQVVDAHHVWLRAERAGTGSGRVYTITITATSRGGTSIGDMTVSVPKD